MEKGGLTGLEGAGAARSSESLSWLAALAAGVAAGVIAWAIAEETMTPFSGLARRQGNADLPAAVVGFRNAVIYFGTLGTALGLGLGLAGGMIHRSLLRTILAGATGAVLGGLAGVAMGRLFGPAYYKNIATDDLTYSLMVHGGAWGAAGAAAGLAFGLGLGGWERILRIMVGGACGALIAAGIYELGGSIMLPLARTSQPVSATWYTRLAACLLVTLLAAAGAALAVGSKRQAQRDNETKDTKTAAGQSG